MSVAEMKKVIYERVEQYEDAKVLQQILSILNAPQNVNDVIDASKHIKQLFAENDGLLKRLA